MARFRARVCGAAGLGRTGTRRGGAGALGVSAIPRMSCPRKGCQSFVSDPALPIKMHQMWPLPPAVLHLEASIHALSPASWTHPLTVPFTYAWLPPETKMIVSHPFFALKEPFTSSESHSFVVAGTCGRFLTHSPSPLSFMSLIDSTLFREFTARDHILEECTLSSYLSPMLVSAQTPMAPDGVNIPSPCNGPWVSER